MIRSFLSLATAVLSVVWAPTLHSQTLSQSERSSVVLALSRGQRLYAFDQAAWHATDKLMEDAKAQGLLERLKSEYGGWIVRDLDSSTLEVIFFDKNLSEPKPLYYVRMSERGTRIVSGEFAGKDAKISDQMTLRMIRARQLALQALEGEPLLRCAKGSYNTVVLPPDTPDGSIPVYILSPQSDLDHVPFGGHARIMVTADGEAGPVHAFTKSCLELPTKRVKDAPKALVATQLLDPLPTEVGVFTMFAAGLPLYVATPDKRIWAIEASGGQARVRLLPAEKK